MEEIASDLAALLGARHHPDVIAIAALQLIRAGLEALVPDWAVRADETARLGIVDVQLLVSDDVLEEAERLIRRTPDGFGTLGAEPLVESRRDLQTAANHPVIARARSKPRITCIQDRDAHAIPGKFPRGVQPAIAASDDSEVNLARQRVVCGRGAAASTKKVAPASRDGKWCRSRSVPLRRR
jgi:hypothetical protein